MERPGTGAVIGGLTGAAAGQIVGGDTRAAVIGGALAAAVGGVVRARMAAQERELRQPLAGTGADVAYDGSQLRVVLPESVTFRTGSSVVDPGFRPELQAVSNSLRGIVAELSARRIHIANPCGQTGDMSKPKPARYRTTNWSAYNAALRKRGSLLIWVDKEMSWHAPYEGRPGRPPVFSDAAIQFCLSIKVLFKLPPRQTAGMVASLLLLAGLDWPVPDCA